MPENTQMKKIKLALLNRKGQKPVIDDFLVFSWILANFTCLGHKLCGLNVTSEATTRHGPWPSLTLSPEMQHLIFKSRLVLGGDGT